MEVVVYAALCEREREGAYGLLARAVEEVFGIAPLPEIAREEGGKPYFTGFPQIHFNVSHSRGAAVCALHDRPVGVDVEKLRTPPLHLGRGREPEEFFRLWTAQEATVKRQGRGIAALVAGVEPDERCVCLEGLLPGYVVTVCPSVEENICTKLIDKFPQKK